MIKENLFLALQELSDCSHELEEAQLQELLSEMRKAKRIFFSGTGRSLMMIRGLAMRMMQLGYQAYVVGETVTPAIEKEDLLVIASGSGETETLCVIAKKCKKVGAALALITTVPDSSIGMISDSILEIKSSTTKNAENTRTSVQLGASTFEQSVLLLGDAIVMELANRKGIEAENQELMRRHANLE